MNTLRQGSTGPDVQDLQNTLNNLGYYLPVTGIFDTATSTAVRSLKAKVGLPVTDESVGDAEMAAFLDYEDKVTGQKSIADTSTDPKGPVINMPPLDITGSVSIPGWAWLLGAYVGYRYLKG